LVTQLPPPILFVGDFNAHNTLWGCSSTDRKGHEVEDFILSSNLCLLNGKDPTYIHPATGSRSSIDLAFCDPSLYLDYSWKVNDDLCGSDHLPIILTKTLASPTSDIQRWKLKQANWDSFDGLCSEELSYEHISRTANPMESFTATLLTIAERTIPKTSKQAHRIRKPWFSDECKAAIAE
jgi:hypothetical protein